MLFKLYGSIKSKNVNQKGIGLGLVITKMIVEKFNGVINFVSKWKKGTTFFFSFETEEFSYLQFKNEVNNKKQIMEFSTDRILVADDEVFCLNSIKNMFQVAKVDLNNVDFCGDG